MDVEEEILQSQEKNLLEKKERVKIVKVPFLEEKEKLKVPRAEVMSAEFMDYCYFMGTTMQTMMKVEHSMPLLPGMEPFDMSLPVGCHQPALLSAELQPHQQECLRYLLTSRHCGINSIIGDEMGLGKTIQVISYLAQLLTWHVLDNTDTETFAITESFLHVSEKSYMKFKTAEMKVSGPLRIIGDLAKMTPLIQEYDDMDTTMECDPVAENSGDPQLDLSVASAEPAPQNDVSMVSEPTSVPPVHERVKHLWNQQSELAMRARAVIERRQKVLRGHLPVPPGFYTPKSVLPVTSPGSSSGGGAVPGTSAHEGSHEQEDEDIFQVRPDVFDVRGRLLSEPASSSPSQSSIHTGKHKEVHPLGDTAKFNWVRGSAGPHLVVCPSSVMANWAQEFRRFCPWLAVHVWRPGAAGPSPAQLKEMRACNVVVCNYTLFDRVPTAGSGGASASKTHALRQTRWDCIVLDEAHDMRNAATARYAALLGLAARHRVLLTGTPVQNSARELTALLRFVSPEFFAEQNRKFVRWEESGDIWVMGGGNEVEHGVKSGSGTVFDEVSKLIEAEIDALKGGKSDNVVIQHKLEKNKAKRKKKEIAKGAEKAPAIKESNEPTLPTSDAVVAKQSEQVWQEDYEDMIKAGDALKQLVNLFVLRRTKLGIRISLPPKRYYNLWVCDLPYITHNTNQNNSKGKNHLKYVMRIGIEGAPLKGRYMDDLALPSALQHAVRTAPPAIFENSDYSEDEEVRSNFVDGLNNTLHYLALRHLPIEGVLARALIKALVGYRIEEELRNSEDPEQTWRKLRAKALSLAAEGPLAIVGSAGALFHYDKAPELLGTGSFFDQIRNEKDPFLKKLLGDVGSFSASVAERRTSHGSQSTLSGTATAKHSELSTGRSAKAKARTTMTLVGGLLENKLRDPNDVDDVDDSEEDLAQNNESSDEEEKRSKKKPKIETNSKKIATKVKSISKTKPSTSTKSSQKKQVKTAQAPTSPTVVEVIELEKVDVKNKSEKREFLKVTHQQISSPDDSVVLVPVVEAKPIVKAAVSDGSDASIEGKKVVPRADSTSGDDKNAEKGESQVEEIIWDAETARVAAMFGITSKRMQNYAMVGKTKQLSLDELMAEKKRKQKEEREKKKLQQQQQQQQQQQVEDEKKVESDNSTAVKNTEVQLESASINIPPTIGEVDVKKKLEESTEGDISTVTPLVVEPEEAKNEPAAIEPPSIFDISAISLDTSITNVDVIEGHLDVSTEITTEKSTDVGIREVTVENAQQHVNTALESAVVSIASPFKENKLKTPEKSTFIATLSGEPSLAMESLEDMEAENSSAAASFSGKLLSMIRRAAIHPLLLRTRYSTAQCLCLARALLDQDRMEKAATAKAGGSKSTSKSSNNSKVAKDKEKEKGKKRNRADSDSESEEAIDVDKLSDFEYYYSAEPESSTHPLAVKMMSFKSDKSLKGDSHDILPEMIEQLENPSFEALKIWARGDTLLARQAQSMLNQSDFSLHQAAMDLPRRIGKKLMLSRDAFEGPPKIRALLSVLMEVRKKKLKMLVFSQFNEALDIVEHVLEANGMSHMRIDGSSEIFSRQRTINAFAGSTTCHVMLLTTRSGGVGINLTCANTVVFLDQDWNAQIMRQAEDRSHRIGQTRGVRVLRLLKAGSVEDYMASVAEEKRKMSDAILQGSKETIEVASPASIHTPFMSSPSAHSASARTKSPA